VTIISDNHGRVLLTRRHHSLRNFPGGWCLPGGKLAPGESPEQAAIRETVEEVSIQCTDLKLLGCFESKEPNRGFEYHIHAFIVINWYGYVNICGASQEVSSYDWVLPRRALEKLPMAGAATKKILERLTRNHDDSNLTK